MSVIPPYFFPQYYCSYLFFISLPRRKIKTLATGSYGKESLGCQRPGAQHMLVQKRSRDTKWYSLLADEEWVGGGMREGMEGWLERGNFDGVGGQRRGLGEVRGEGLRRRGERVDNEDDKKV